MERLEKGRMPPEEMFKPPNVKEGTYASWDEKGLPLTDGEGKEISKSAGKKAVKQWDNQNKLHEEWVAWQSERGPA
jgi:cysteinyl-tRNA synthetase